MSKKRDKHLLANEVDEIRFRTEEERRIYEINKHRSKAPKNPWSVSRSFKQNRHGAGSGGGFRDAFDGGCLWELAKYILVPAILVCLVGILKACS